MKGKVYLLCDPEQNLYKIGITRGKTDKRLKQLQTGNGTELHVVMFHETDCPFRMESMLHSHFAVRRTYGEWFALTTEEVIGFKDTCLMMEDIIDALKDNPFFNKR